MAGSGKISRSFFEAHVAPNLGAERDDVALGPAHGCDFGVIRPEGSSHATVLATDPVSILPALGFDRAARFALHIVLSDVAVSGIPPSHLSIAFALPPEIADSEFATLWGAVHEECAALDIAVTTGHTARYPGCSFPWVGAATAIGVGDPDRIVRPDGAQPGDRLVVTKGPAVEATGLFASLYPDRLDLLAETVATAQERLDDVRLVRDALTAREAGEVHAMHDATEGGLLGAFHEMAAATAQRRSATDDARSAVQFAVESDAVPRQPGVTDVCAALEMDPWTATTAGTLVAAVDAADAEPVVDALRERGTPAAVVGEVRAATADAPAVVVDGEATTAPEGDASWPVYERLSGVSE
ncbi:AIR synthase family protein [Haloparvum sp. AD34]